MKKKWIQKAFKHRKKGALHKELGFNQDEKIPFHILLAIKNAKIGDYIENTPRGKIKITRLLKKRAIFLYNLDKIKRK